MNMQSVNHSNQRLRSSQGVVVASLSLDVRIHMWQRVQLGLEAYYYPRDEALPICDNAAGYSLLLGVKIVKNTLLYM